MEYEKDIYSISDDKQKLDLDVIHGFLTTSYWASGISRETIIRAVENSLSFGVYDSQEQVGFARVITDFATFAYLADVFIIDTYQGRGLANWLIECIKEHPDLQDVRRWLLTTRDAYELYRRYGFQKLSNPERWMESKSSNT